MKVKCIDNKNFEMTLSKDKVYEVFGNEAITDKKFLIIKGDSKEVGVFLASRFEEVKEKQYISYLEAVEVDKDLCLTIAMEECAELIQAISKAKRGKLNRDNLVEEMADVLICLEWIGEIFDIDTRGCGELQKWYDKKENRVVERLNKGEFK